MSSDRKKTPRPSRAKSNVKEIEVMDARDDSTSFDEVVPSHRRSISLPEDLQLPFRTRRTSPEWVERTFIEYNPSPSLNHPLWLYPRVLFVIWYILGIITGILLPINRREIVYLVQERVVEGTKQIPKYIPNIDQLKNINFQDFKFQDFKDRVQEFDFKEGVKRMRNRYRVRPGSSKEPDWSQYKEQLGFSSTGDDINSGFEELGSDPEMQYTDGYSESDTFASSEDVDDESVCDTEEGRKRREDTITNEIQRLKMMQQHQDQLRKAAGYITDDTGQTYITSVDIPITPSE